MKNKIIVIIIIMVFASFVSDKPAYKIFNSKGETSEYDKMLQDVLVADIVLFGEQHNNPVCHWLEIELTKDVFKNKKDKLIIGAEMYESDNQLIVNEYINSIISERSFKSDCRLWPNDATDYKPLIDFAKNNKIKFVASNVPRRYASLVNKKGFEGLDSLGSEEKKYFAPLPVKYDPELKCYKDMLQMGGMGEGGMPGMGGKPAKSGMSNLPKAQAIKDATMAYFISNNLKKGNLFIHYNGAYHSDYYQGICWYLKQYNPNLKIITISSLEQDDINTLQNESLNIADYIICIPKSMTKTY